MLKKKLSVSVLCRVAFLIALEVVLSRFCSINTMGLRIGFSFVPIALCAVMYGPVVAAAAYALADVLGTTLFPMGPFFPGFTLSSAMMGLVYGFFLYRRDFWGSGSGDISASGVKALRPGRVRAMVYIFSATLINCLGIGLCLNTLWINILYGHDYVYWFMYRLPEYAVLVPLNIILLPFIVKLSDRIKHVVK